MASSSKIVKIVAAVVVVVGVGGFVGWWAGRPPEGYKPPAPVVEMATQETAAAKTNTFFTKAKTDKPVEVSEGDTGPVTNWDDRVDEILRNDSEYDEKARQMLAILPRMPVEGQAETVQHIGNLLPDEEYAKLGKYYSDPSVDAKVKAAMEIDLLNRPNEIKLPVLLATARNHGNSNAADAKEALVGYLDQDFGDDWAKWEKALAAWLAENPD